MRCLPWIPSKHLPIIGVGEAPGEEEDRQGFPFLGYSGQELDRMLLEAGFNRSQFPLTNVFMDRPPNNNLNFWTLSKAQAYDKSKSIGWDYALSPISQGKYLDPFRFWELIRLRNEIEKVKPNLVVAFGNTALWALCGVTGISKFRGTILESTLIPGLKVLPTFHPAAILRTWEWRTFLLSDLIKAKEEMSYPEIIYPEREIWIEPSIRDLYRFKNEHLPAKILSVDIELVGPFVSCVGLAPSADCSIVIPFVRLDGSHYWANKEDELIAWDFIEDAINSAPSVLMQNGIFDTMHLLVYGIAPRNYNRDTMFKHHAIYPGIQKSLAFMGSLYTNERAWKILRPRARRDSEKDSE